MSISKLFVSIDMYYYYYYYYGGGGGGGASVCMSKTLSTPLKHV